MTYYTQQVNNLLKDALELPRSERLNFLQQLINLIIRTDSAALIGLLRKNGIADEKIGKSLGVSQSIISRKFPREEKKA